MMGIRSAEPGAGRTGAARAAGLETHISTEDGFGGHNRACNGLVRPQPLSVDFQ
jgi:hypothetical protein